MSLYLSQKQLLILLLSSFAIGFLLALLYDGLRIFRALRTPQSRFGRVLHIILVSVEDLLFFLFCGVVFAILFFVTNSGEVRPFGFVMAFLGFLFCRLSLSKVLFPLFLRFFLWVKGLISRLLYLLRRPLMVWFRRMKNRKKKEKAPRQKKTNGRRKSRQPQMP